MLWRPETTPRKGERELSRSMVSGEGKGSKGCTGRGLRGSLGYGMCWNEERRPGEGRPHSERVGPDVRETEDFECHPWRCGLYPVGH